MTNLLSQVTPLTRGLLWFCKDGIGPDQAFYKDIDYLLNGLLTATLKNVTSSSSHVLVSENFGQTLYVIIGTSISEKELESYFELIKTKLTAESDLILIDELNSFNQIQNLAPAEVKSKIHVIR
jgi:hypothetical protein